ncbi:unnamed protein product [Darwinula stevensoni]|uniref:peptidylprolyl isomerase n=1 Tax=Darwinula stevensoni TaxID=69355 RepID=A0A7R8X8E2_9CRUS|nr:unnamed protein product [Darwinula stevensoni]CAG0889599.1 unnamed protein product [Darwinula stevensoni]
MPIASIEPMQIDAPPGSPEDNENEEIEQHIVENTSLKETEHKNDLESYASQYSGFAKLNRLLYVADHCPPLRVEALKLAVTHIQTTYNVNLYQIIHRKLLEASGRLPGGGNSAPNGPGSVPDVASQDMGHNIPPYDSQWAETRSKKAALKLEKLDTDLKNYKTNSIKESIRRGHDDLGDHYLDIGDLNNALKCYIRARDYCTSGKHLIHMCLNVIKVSVYLQNWSNVLSYVSKAEATPDLVEAKKQQISHSKNGNAKTITRLKCAAGLAELATKKYKSAARHFLMANVDHCDFPDLMSPSNVAIYGGLCALASFDRHELQKHALYSEIRNRALIQYFSPYVSADMQKMAEAFNTTVLGLEDELMQLILAGQIQARIDSHNKILHAKAVDQRCTTFEKALQVGDDFQRRAKALILRAAILKAQIQVKRRYAIQAATKTSEKSKHIPPKEDPIVTALPNGIVVASHENYCPVSRIGIFVKAGSRYESSSNAGVSHMLRIAAGLASKKETAFGITRNIMQIGGSLTCSASREYLAYTVEFLRDDAYVAQNLDDFVKETFTTNRLAIAGVGVDHKLLENFATACSLPGGEGDKTPSPYGGGEIRIECGGPLTSVAMAVEGFSVQDAKAMAAGAIFQHALGTGPYVKRGMSAGVLSKAAASSASGSFAVSALNMNYSDAGLLGFYLVGQPDEIDKVMRSVAAKFRGGNVSDEDLQRGKASLISHILMDCENSENVLECLGVQGLLMKKYKTPQELIHFIESVSTADVNNVAKKVASGMGNADSKHSFRNAVIQLTQKRQPVDPSDDAFWEQFWCDQDTIPADFFTHVPSTEIRTLREETPSNLATLCYKAVEKLVKAVDSCSVTTHQEQLAVLNCVRILMRLLPYIFEDPEWSNYFWSRLPSQEGKDDNLLLAESLLLTLSDLLFCPDFTVASTKKGGPDRHEDLHSIDSCEYIWEAGVGFATPPPHNPQHDLNRTEILRLLLTCFSETMYFHPNEEASTRPSRWVRYFTSTENRHALPLFTSLLNTVCSYNPAGMGVPYNHLLFTDHREPLVDIALQLLIVTLDVDSSNSEAETEDETHHVDNLFINYLSRIHREEDFAFMLRGFTRLLNNPLTQTYLPHSIKKVNFHQELLVLFWKCCEYNKKFLYYVLKSSEVLEILVPILYHLNDSRADQCELYSSLYGDILKKIFLESFRNRKVTSGISAIHLVLVSIQTGGRVFGMQGFNLFVTEIGSHSDHDTYGITGKVIYCFLARVQAYGIQFGGNGTDEVWDIRARVGLMHIGVFILLLLSGERNFGVRLNKPYTASIPMDIPVFTGTHADLLVIVFHKIITTGHARLQPLFDCLLTILVNVSPYLKTLSMVASTKLLHLLEAFSTPWFLFSAPNHHHLIFFLLEIFNNIIQYQFDGNSNLVYTLIRKRAVFHQLANLATDSSSIQKSLNKRTTKEKKRSNSSSSVQSNPASLLESPSMEGSRPAMPAEPGTLKATLAATPGIDKMTEQESAHPSSQALENLSMQLTSAEQEHGGGPIPSMDPPTHGFSTPQGVQPPHRSRSNSLDSDTVPFEKRTHQSTGQSASSHSEDELPPREETGSGAATPKEGWKPNPEWVASWKQKLPLQTIMRLLQVLVPQVEKICIDKGLTDESEILRFLQHGTLVGLLPVPHPILIRKYQANSGTTNWFRTYIWGIIYLRQITKGVSELKEKEGIVFEADVTDAQIEASYVKDPRMLDHVNLESLGFGGGNSSEDDGKSPFEQLAVQMYDLTGDGGVLKKMHVSSIVNLYEIAVQVIKAFLLPQNLKSGSGVVVPERAFVKIHFDAYIEYSGEPVDSTYLRGKMEGFRLGTQKVIPGLELAVGSMRKGEKSQFLIHHKYAFGKKGCPPRIPSEAMLLFCVELLHFLEDEEATMADMSAEERRSAGFAFIAKIIKRDKRQGTQLFRENDFRGAVGKYKKALRNLENCWVKDEEEEKKKNAELVKLYLNEALCHFKLGHPTLCIQACKNVHLLDVRNCKNHFRWAQALRLLGEFPNARRKLRRAEELDPGNEEIKEEFRRLKEAEERARVAEKLRCERMLNVRPLAPDDNLNYARTGARPKYSSPAFNKRSSNSCEIQDTCAWVGDNSETCNLTRIKPQPAASQSDAQQEGSQNERSTADQENRKKTQNSGQDLNHQSQESLGNIQKHVVGESLEHVLQKGEMVDGSDLMDEATMDAELEASCHDTAKELEQCSWLDPGLEAIQKSEEDLQKTVSPVFVEEVAHFISDLFEDAQKAEAEFPDLLTKSQMNYLQVRAREMGLCILYTAPLPPYKCKIKKLCYDHKDVALVVVNFLMEKQAHPEGGRASGTIYSEPPVRPNATIPKAIQLSPSIPGPL